MANRLEYRAEFEKLISHYRPSAQGMKLLSGLRLVLLCGPSASGRNTVINRLLDNDAYYFIVSDTTRAPRVNNGVAEKNGVTYFFRSEDEFLAELKHGDFLEAEIIHQQQVSGISLRELSKARAARKIAITDIDLGGLQRVTMLKPDTTAVTILPPSFDVWMERLNSRGTLSLSEIKHRLLTSTRIFALAAEGKVGQLVVNDRLDRSAEEVDALACGIEPAGTGQKRELALELLAQTENYLRHA